MPGGLGRNQGFHSDLNGAWQNLSRWEIEGVGVCVCARAVDNQTGKWFVDHTP